MKSKTIPQEIYNKVETELLEGEQLLWVGLPGARTGLAQNRLATKLGIMLAVMFGVLVAALTMFARGGAMMMANSTNLWVFGMIVALFLIAAGASVVQNLRLNKHGIYVITDQRVLIIGNRAVQSYGENDIDFIERQMRSNGKGDIIFKRVPRTRGAYYGSGMYGSRLYDEPIGFFGIDNPREVEALMLQTFRARGDNRRLEKPKRDALDESDAPIYADDDLQEERLTR